jgi:cytochrome P450
MHDSSLLQQVRDEVSPAVKGENVDETYLIEHCPKLESLINEVLRLMVTSSLARVVMEPTIVGGKLLQPGSKLMVCLVLRFKRRKFNSQAATNKRTAL